MATVIRPLRPTEIGAFDTLRDFLEGVRTDIPQDERRRLRVFFQDNPTTALRVAEDDHEDG